MIVLLVSYPRSGNTMFRIVANTIFGIPSTALAPASDEVFFGAGISHEVGCLPQVSVKSPELDSLGNGPLLVKTHEIDPLRFPIIYIVRDGRDCLMSFARYGHGSIGFESRLWQLILGEVPEAERLHIGRWSEHVLAHLPHAAAVVQYERMVAQPVAEVGRALRGAGLPVKAIGSSPPSFKRLKERMPAFFRRGAPGSWRTEMPPDALAPFWKHHGAAMIAAGYER